MNCRSCGAEVPALTPSAGSTPACPACGKPLAPTSADRTLVEPSTRIGAGPTSGAGDTFTRGGAPDTGDRFAGYEILEALGRGGMGAVYRARRPDSRLEVALKVLLAGRGADPDEIVRFKREAQMVAELRHPGIVAIHDIGEADGCPYFTMDLVSGPSLARLLRDRGRLPPRRAMELVRDVARALAHAHGQGIVHRDLKPGNVMLADGERPVVMDFGIARRLGAATRLTRTGAILGTPSYMAPEQAEGGAATGEAVAIGPHTDVYSLGVILYECLTGRLPFEGTSEIQIVWMVLNQEPQRPTRMAPDLPREVELVCLKAMDKEIRRRYATAAELADDIDRWLAGEPVFARPLTRAERVARFVRRRRAAVIGLAAGLVLALSGAAWAVSATLESLRARARKQACEQAVQAGLRLYSTRRFEDALARFAEAVDLDPTSETAQLNRAQMLRELGRVDEARAALEAAVQAIPNSSSAAHQLGSLHFDQGRFEEAVRNFSVAIALEPEHAMAWMNRGYARLKLGRREEALADLEEAIRLDDRFAEAYLRRGIVRRERGEWDLSRGDHDRAVELNGQAAENWYQRAKLRLERGDAEGALADATEAIRLGSVGPDVHLVRGQALHALRRNRDALKELQAALDADPKHAASLAQAGYVLNDLGLPAKAVAVLERALALDEGNASAWLNLGNARLFLGELEKAAACYDRALALAPRDAKALSNRAMARQRLGRPEEARADARAALEIDPEFGAPHCVLGLVSAGEGKHAEALAEFATASRLGMRGLEAELEVARAWSLRQLERWTEAEEACARGLEASPAHPGVLKLRAELFVRQGKLPEALADFAAWAKAAPEDGAAWFGLGWAQAALGRPADAAQSFGRARDQGYDPQSFATLRRATSLSEAGDGATALREVDAVLAREPENAAAYQARGLVLMRLGRWDEADASLAEFCAREPKEAGGPYNRACNAARAGRADAAFGFLERALELGYRDARALEADADLAALRADARFAALVARMR